MTPIDAPGWDGRVYVDEAGRVTVEVDGRQAPVRQRFTVAHELLHTAFPGFRRERRYRVDDDLELALFSRSRAEEEQLCDWGAEPAADAGRADLEPPRRPGAARR